MAAHPENGLGTEAFPGAGSKTKTASAHGARKNDVSSWRSILFFCNAVPLGCSVWSSGEAIVAQLASLNLTRSFMSPSLSNFCMHVIISFPFEMSGCVSPFDTFFAPQEHGARAVLSFKKFR